MDEYVYTFSDKFKNLKRQSFIETELFIKKSSSINNTKNRGLIAAILDRALTDALSRNPEYSRSAKKFINNNNPLFCKYCEMIELNPEWVAKKIQKIICEHELKKKS